MAYYKDFREYLNALEQKGKLTRIKREINKDTQLHPLVRLEFRGLPEEERTAFLFENVVDSRGHKYESPVAVAALAGSSQIYAIGMMCQHEEIAERIIQAELHPIEPKLVNDGPVQEEIHAGDNLLEHGGLEEFPIPIKITVRGIVRIQIGDESMRLIHITESIADVKSIDSYIDSSGVMIKTVIKMLNTTIELIKKKD